MLLGRPAPQSAYLLSHVRAATRQIGLPVGMLGQAHLPELAGYTFPSLETHTGRLGQTLDPGPLAVHVAQRQDPPFALRVRKSRAGGRGDLLLVPGFADREEDIAE